MFANTLESMTFADSIISAIILVNFTVLVLNNFIICPFLVILAIELRMLFLKYITGSCGRST